MTEENKEMEWEAHALASQAAARSPDCSTWNNPGITKGGVLIPPHK